MLINYLAQPPDLVKLQKTVPVFFSYTLTTDKKSVTSTSAILIMIKLLILLHMKKVTIQDFRIAMLKVTKSKQTNDLLNSLSDEELFEVNIEQDLHVFHGGIEGIIRQISVDKQIILPHELHKVLSDGAVSTLVNTVNLCIQEEVKLGLIKP